MTTTLGMLRISFGHGLVSQLEYQTCKAGTSRTFMDDVCSSLKDQLEFEVNSKCWVRDPDFFSV